MTTTPSSKRELKGKLTRARKALDHILCRMLDMNKAKKQSRVLETSIPGTENLQDELKLLNRIADQQAWFVRLYEDQLQKFKTASIPSRPALSA